MRSIGTALVVWLIVVAQPGETEPAERESAHPFLIVTRADYGGLQARSLVEPWSSMKAASIKVARSLSYVLGDPLPDRIDQMSDIVSAAALAYIVDPPNRGFYREKLVATLGQWNDLRQALTREICCGSLDRWSIKVPPGSAFFNSVLALDIVRNDLTPKERDSIEDTLNQMIEAWRSWELFNRGHLTNTHAVLGIWALYRGDRKEIDHHKAAYRAHLFGDLTSDGVFNQGTGYGRRLVGPIESKAHFLDVLEFTGEDTYYSDHRLRTFYEWLFAHSVTPFRRLYSFGDAGPNRSVDPTSAAMFRAHRFSETAARYAAWNSQGYQPRGRLLHYVLMDRPLPPPMAPRSRIYPDGGAWFVDRPGSERALSVALWNPRHVWISPSGGSHAHKDVNAIHVSAYGQHILRNSGYRGWGKGALGFSWNYVNSTAVSSNTVLIDGLDHVAKSGGGIREGLTSADLDYASGDSGGALPNGVHHRSIVLLHSTPRTRGYVVLLDEVWAVRHGSVSIALHPNADNLSADASDPAQYHARIRTDAEASGPHARHPAPHSGVFLSLFLASTPRTVEIRDGLLANMGDVSTSLVGRYLYASYDVSAGGKRQVATVLIPYVESLPERIQRISGDGYSGAVVHHPTGLRDWIVESSRPGLIAQLGATVDAAACIYRSDDRGGPISYFVRQGGSFDTGETARQGFTADAKVSTYMRGATGVVISPGTLMTVFHPGVTGVELDRSGHQVIASGRGWIRFFVPPGTHDIVLVKGSGRGRRRDGGAGARGRRW